MQQQAPEFVSVKSKPKSKEVRIAIEGERGRILQKINLSIEDAEAFCEFLFNAIQHAKTFNPSPADRAAGQNFQTMQQGTSKPQPEQYGYPDAAMWTTGDGPLRYSTDLNRWQSEQDPEVEDPFGEDWRNRMLREGKYDLVAALKNALTREQTAQADLRSLKDENTRLRAELARLKYQ